MQMDVYSMFHGQCEEAVRVGPCQPARWIVAVVDV